MWGCINTYTNMFEIFTPTTSVFLITRLNPHTMHYWKKKQKKKNLHSLLICFSSSELSTFSSQLSKTIWEVRSRSEWIKSSHRAHTPNWHRSHTARSQQGVWGRGAVMSWVTDMQTLRQTHRGEGGLWSRGPSSAVQVRMLAATSVLLSPQTVSAACNYPVPCHNVFSWWVRE